MNIILRLKDNVKNKLFYLMDWYFLTRKYFSKKSYPENILLIRLDSLGDYILFRNFIQILKNSEKFFNHKITLLGSTKWKELAENLDGELIDEFIWIDDLNNYLMNIKKRYTLMKELSGRKFKYLINPTISRDYNSDDFFSRILDAKIKIGCSGDHTNISLLYKEKSDKFYDELININNEIKFEFYRNKEFFEKLLNKRIELEKPFIQLSKHLCNETKDKEYALVIPEAGHSDREWGLENFDTVVKHLINKYDLDIYIIGSNREKNIGEKLVNLNKKNKIFNLTGKTDSYEIIGIINEARIMISNETGPVHIAALLDTKTVCISNGNNLYRFNPYPNTISSSIKYIYPEIIRENLNDKEKLKNFWKGSRLKMNLIKKSEVINEIDKILMD